MRAKHFIAAAWAFALLSSGCLRLVDRPEEEGAPGTECYDNSECAAGAVCLTGVSFKGTCSEVGACETHFECGQQEACMNGRCQAVQCTSVADSACGNYACNSDTFTCKTTCDSNGNCQNDTVCRAGSCVSSKCTAETAAVVCEGYTCDTVLSQCRGEFMGSSCDSVGCATGYTCLAHSCRKACSANGATTQCGNYLCEVTSEFAGPAGTCATQCYEHTECLNGTVCINFRCTTQ